MVWANATWQENDEVYQRLLFFENRNGRYRQTATDSNFWGELEYHPTDWGGIYHYEVDGEWIEDINAFVADYCQQTCESFSIMLTDNYVETAVPQQIIIPSPRLLGVNEEGKPSALFWQQLRQNIEDRLMPTTIRFALPPPRRTPCCRNLDYESAAAEFMRQNPHIKVELVPVDNLPDDISLLAKKYDSAALPPTIDMVTAGEIYDLTDFANTDPDFVANDFYEHIWQGVQWRERMWFMPLAAEFNLLYYDKTAYETADIPEPNLFWQWLDMSENTTAMLADPSENSSLTWQFIDTSSNALFAYAYSLADSCPDTDVPPCLQSLQTHHIANTLEWYKDLVQRGQIPDLTQQSDDERDWIMNNFQSAKRHALYWVGEPIFFEYYLLLDAVGVVPFPGVATMEGVTPLWIDGAFISSQSKYPYATWQWLKFLSHQPPVKSYRLVPARSSVAAKTQFWQNLPRPLVDPMRTAYTFSRPVTLPEKHYFDWTQLGDVVSETYTPREIAQELHSINWFEQK